MTFCQKAASHPKLHGDAPETKRKLSAVYISRTGAEQLQSRVKTEEVYIEGRQEKGSRGNDCGTEEGYVREGVFPLAGRSAMQPGKGGIYVSSAGRQLLYAGLRMR